MEMTSFFPGLIALVIAALLGFIAAWIWRGKRLATAEKQAARLRRERREMTAKMTQASRKFTSLSEQRTNAVDELSTLKQQHQALETGHAQLIAKYANLKKGGQRNTTDADGSGNRADSDEEWFDGMDSSSSNQVSQDKREALDELKAFENQLSSVSGQLAQDNQSAVLERHSPDATASQVAQPVVDTGETDALKVQVAEQEAEIQRLREQMAPLLGLPLAVSTREAERDRLADVLKNKEQEILDRDKEVAGKDQALADKESELARKQQEIASKQQEIAGKDQQIAGKEQAIAGQEREIADKSKALEMKDQTIAEKLQEVQSAQKAAQIKQLEVSSKEQTIEEKEKEIAELNAALRQRTEREATLNRELATAKRAEDTHREEIRRLAADKERELQAAHQMLADAKREAKKASAVVTAKEDTDALHNKSGNLSREVKDSSASIATPAPEPVANTKPTGSGNTTGVQAAPLGSTVAVNRLPTSSTGPRPVNGSANVAAVDRSAPANADKPAPRQFERAPSRVDNLKEIKGIGPVLERMLNRLGVYQFRQIASWSDEDIDYFDTQLADFRGRIRRDDWRAGAGAAFNRKYD